MAWWKGAELNIQLKNPNYFKLALLVYTDCLSGKKCGWLRLHCISFTITMVSVFFSPVLQRVPTCHVGVAGYSAIAPILLLHDKQSVCSCRANLRYSHFSTKSLLTPLLYQAPQLSNGEWFKLQLSKMQVSVIKRPHNIVIFTLTIFCSRWPITQVYVREVLIRKNKQTNE